MDPNSPEGKLASTRAELETAKKDLATLKASAAPEASAALKAELATAKKDLATAQTEKTRLQAALDHANAKLAAKGEAPSLTTMERIKAKAAEMSAAKANASLSTGNVLTKAEKDNLYEQMSKLPAGEQRAFYERNIKGKIAA